MYLNTWLKNNGVPVFSPSGDALRQLVLIRRALVHEYSAVNRENLRANMTAAFGECDAAGVPFKLQNAALAYAEATAKDA